MSANEASPELKAKTRGPRGRRWYRAALFALLASAVVLLSAGVYRRLRPSDPEPPQVDLQGFDPAIVAAVEEASATVRASPRSAAAWGRLGMVLVVHDFRPQANFCLTQAERLDPREPRWPYYQALGALIVADADGALPKLERTVGLCGDDPDAPRVRLAELLLSQNRLDEAEMHFRRLLQTNPSHPRAQLGLARLLHQRGDPQASLQLLSLAQKDKRTQKAACLLTAEICQGLGKNGEAEEARQRATGLPEDPYWPDPLNEEVTDLATGKQAWINRARRFSDLGREAEALALLQRTVRDYSDADDAWLQLGKTLLKQKDAPAAEKALRRATELAPRAHENIFYLGAALVVRGDMPAATKCFRETIELKPDFAPAHYNLGNCLVDAGNPAAAIDAYRAALRCEPNLFEAHLNLATLLAEKGQQAEALVHARHALQLRPSDARVQNLMGRMVRVIVFPPGLF